MLTIRCASSRAGTRDEYCYMIVELLSRVFPVLDVCRECLFCTLSCVPDKTQFCYGLSWRSFLATHHWRVREFEALCCHHGLIYLC